MPPEPLRLLVVSEFWSPAVLAGSARNTERAVQSLGGDVETWVLAGDRDVGATTPLAGIEHGVWVDRGGVQTNHGPWGLRAGARMLAAVRTIDPHVVYCPSLFSLGSLATLLLRVGRRRTLVVAPEGELQPGPMQQRRFRKGTVLRLLRASGSLRNVRWRATDDDEASVIASAVGSRATIAVAPTLPGPATEALPREPKTSGRAHLVHLASINPKKGLRRVLEALADTSSEVRLSLVGPVVDPREEAACRRLADSLPANVTVEWRGAVDHAQVSAILAGADALILPTRGENFGYVVLEALDQGCPVIISDRTPWNHLGDAGAGWVLDLDDLDAWRDAVRAVVALDTAGAVALSDRARVAAHAAHDRVDVDAWRTVLLP